jgi:glycosyltransferase involved in cell wall biosynthesis
MGLEDNITFLGTMKPEEVRRHMEKAAIFMFTSNFEEGWGAVLNEAMNSGCGVVASHAIGSVPFLLKHKENGLIYRNENVDDLYVKIKYLLDHPDEQKKMGVNAYRTVADVWNSNIAAERFLKLVTQIQKKGQCNLFDEGPCSRAANLKNNWFKEDN